MPAKRETHEERSTRFQRRAVEETLKGLHKRCEEAMRRRPDTLTQVYKVLHAAGAIEQDQDMNRLLGIQMEEPCPVVTPTKG